MKVCPVCRYCYEDADTACANGHGVLLPSRHGGRLIADKYRLERLLGRGGMGAVYAGVHVELDRPTAVKLLLPDFLWDSQALERFRREARAAARLNHPNIVDTYDYGLLPTGEAYIVMEVVDGQTLREYMDAAHALPFAEAVHIGRQIADGVDAAHHGGIIHRDLKPSNIILTRDHRGRVLVKVVDFGIAKLKELSTSGGLSSVTNTGAIVGTPRYMSPEQCAGADVDARSDIYSLGVILYEMLAGRPPFDAPSATALALKQVQEQPAPLRSLRPDAPEEVAQVVMHTLAKDPARRPQTARELALTLGTIEQTLLGDEETPGATIAAAVAQAATFDPASRTAGDALKETGATARPPATISPPGGSHPTDRAGTPTGEITAGPKPEAQPGAVNRDGPHPAESSIPSGVAAHQAQEVSAAPAAGRGHDPEPATPATALTPSAAPAPSAGAAPSAVPAPSTAAPDPAPAPVQNVRVSERPIFTAPPPGRHGRTLAFALAALAAVVGLGALYALTRRGNAPAPPAASSAPAPADDRPAPQASPPPDAAGQTTTPADAAAASAPSEEVDEAELIEAPEAQRRAVVKALNQWVAATNARDVNGQLAHYAPRLTSFYLTRGASREAVKAEKVRTFGQAEGVRISIDDPVVRLARDGRTAVVRFRKQFAIDAAGQRRSGEVLQELHWARTGSGWKITSERDLQVIR